MKRLALFILLLILSASEARAQDILLGSAKADITPPSGTPLSGYGRLRGKPTRGMHDPIYARALSVRSGEQAFVFVSLDLCLIDAKLRASIFKKIKAFTDLPEENLILFATHTHTGPGAIGGRFWERFIMGKFDKKLHQMLSEKVAAAVLESLNDQIMVTAEFGRERIDDMIENRMDPKLDHLPKYMKVLRFKTQTGKVAGQMIFMAAHPTLAPANELLLSADFPGVLTDTLEKKFPNSTALFVNGAAADLRPRTGHFDDKFERLKVYGTQLAEKASNMKFETVSLDGPWKAAVKNVKLPRVQVRTGIFKVPSLIGNRFFPRKTRFQSVRMDKFVFLTFPGEIASNIGHEIENRIASQGYEPFFMGYANDYIAYVVSHYHYRQSDEYEASVSFYGKHMDWFLQRTADSMFDAVLSKAESAAANPPGQLDFKEGIAVLRLQGHPYHRGFEEGRLLHKEIRQGLAEIFAYFRSEIPVPLVNRGIINTVANGAWKKMEPYISYDEYNLIKGLADGAGVSFKQMKQLHAMPELFPTLCSNGAYWGEATADGNLIALRNLDWNRKMGVQNKATVKYIVSPGGRDYVNIGYSGFAGVLSGINEDGISVGQIGATSSDETMRGVPMIFLLRRVISESSTVEDAAAVFRRTPLTRGYNYVITDADEKKAIVIEATQNHLAVFQDNDDREKDVPYAFRLKNAVFRGDPALDPAIRDLQWASKGNPKKDGLEMPAGSAYEIRYLKHGKLVEKNYGKITPRTAQDIALEIAPGSNIQSVVYAFPHFYVANAKDHLRAAESGYIHFNLEKLKN